MLRKDFETENWSSMVREVTDVAVVFLYATLSNIVL